MCGGIEGHHCGWNVGRGQFSVRQGLVLQRQIWVLLTDSGRPLTGLKARMLHGVVCM